MVTSFDALNDYMNFTIKKELNIRYNMRFRSVYAFDGFIDKKRVVVIYFNKSYKLGTIGYVEGKIIEKAFKYACIRRLPVISIVSSGGMRIQEGNEALFQMVNISAAIKQHSDNGLLYIAIVGNPTLGGTSASLVALADIIIAECDAIYGFSGRRIVEKTTGEQLDDDFQTAEFAKKYGMVDIVIDKKSINQIISILLVLHSKW